jgi:hypothetical protein
LFSLVGWGAGTSWNWWYIFYCCGKVFLVFINIFLYYLACFIHKKINYLACFTLSQLLCFFAVRNPVFLHVHFDQSAWLSILWFIFIKRFSMIILVNFATNASYGNFRSLLVIVASQCLKMGKVVTLLFHGLVICWSVNQLETTPHEVEVTSSNFFILLLLGTKNYLLKKSDGAWLTILIRYLAYMQEALFINMHMQTICPSVVSIMSFGVFV